MAVAKWNTPSAQGANIASTTLDTKTNGSTSAFITYDNSTNLDLYANVEVDLGSLTGVAGGSITLRVFSSAGANAPDFTGDIGGGDAYTQPVTVGASAKVVVFPMIRLYPTSLRLCVTNNTGNTTAGSGNALKVQPFNESVA